MCDKEKKACNCHDHSKCVCDCEEHTDACCDCGCEDDIIELTMDNGETHKFYSDGTIEYEGKYYAAFEPAEKIEGLEDGDVVIFEVIGDEEDAELVPVEDDKLLDAVFNEFCRLFDEEEALREQDELDGDAE